jgi:preprotein translocase subunit Sec61beta
VRALGGGSTGRRRDGGANTVRTTNETFRTRRRPEADMSGSNSGGLMSSAGLVRYFENEDRNAIAIDPKTVLAFCVLFGVFVQILSLTVA